MKSFCHHCCSGVLPAAAFCHVCGTAAPEEARADATHVTPYARATALVRIGNMDEAAAAYTDIIAHQPADAEAYVALAQGLCVLREWEAEEGKEGIGVTAVVA